MIRFVLALLFSVCVGAAHAADMTPSHLQETLNTRLDILLASDSTIKAKGRVSVTKTVGDWIIVYPAMQITNTPEHIYTISPSRITLKNPDDLETGEAIVELPANISESGKSQTVLEKQNLKGTWSFTEHALSAINGTIGKVTIQKLDEGSLMAFNEIGLNITATLNNPDTVDLNFNLSGGTGVSLPPSVISGFMPQGFSAKGTVLKLPKEYLILGAMMPLARSRALTKAGTEIHVEKIDLQALNGAQATGMAHLTANAIAKRNISGQVYTRWTNLAGAAQKMQSGLMSAGLSPEEKKARTQQMLVFMLAQSLGAQEGPETVFNVDLLPTGATIVNGKDLNAVGSTLLGNAMSQIPPQMMPKGQIPVDSMPRNP